MKNLMKLLLIALLMSYSPLLAQYETGLVAANRGDFVTAVQIWKPLAEAGQVDAQCDMGLMYYKGDGIPQDFKEAAKWFHKAADQGNAKAQYLLALLYYKGRGVEKSGDEAVRWFKKAAEQGDQNSLFNLGHMFSSGQGTPQDHVEAYKYFFINASQGDEDSSALLESIGKEMTPEQIEKAKTQAQEWQKSHCSKE